VNVFLCQAAAECLKIACTQSVVMSSIDSLLSLSPSEVIIVNICSYFNYFSVHLLFLVVGL